MEVMGLAKSYKAVYIDLGSVMGASLKLEARQRPPGVGV
jgi:hypothetical protein